ncbi:bifunctional peptidase and (3S)-lysyl hydroxylase Jmjd7-like [Amphiura filiformis]|uniref:bifunctional peptidase and (3S)-lysyl hydroxylase Jmjd7-like n=1 Tax=Amphiura filiformis TaxID=82378 RepID=UPI003B21A7BE
MMSLTQFLTCCKRTVPQYFLLVTMVTLILAQEEEKVKFPKDQRVNVVFPPRFTARSKSTLVIQGHLRPFGWQRKPDGRVKQYNDALDPAMFWEDFVKKNKPVVYSQITNNSPAFTDWTDDYLKQSYGHVDVVVEMKKEDRSHLGFKKVPMSTFIDKYHEEDWYLVNLLPDEMRQDVQVPKSLLCGTFRKYIQEGNLWMSSGGTISQIHYHGFHEIHCLQSGRKDFIMVNPIFAKYLEVVEENPWTGTGHSTIDVDMINMYQYPDVEKAQWTWTTLNPGDCIYVPAGYLHQVRAYGRSISTTILFNLEPEFNDTDCGNATLDYTTLKDVKLMWTYKHGDRVIDLAHRNPEHLRENFLSILRSEDRLPFGRFGLYFKDLVLNDEESSGSDIPEEAKEVFQIFDTQNKGYLTRKEILDMEIEKFEDLARLIEIPGTSMLRDEL